MAVVTVKIDLTNGRKNPLDRYLKLNQIMLIIKPLVLFNFEFEYID